MNSFLFNSFCLQRSDCQTCKRLILKLPLRTKNCPHFLPLGIALSPQTLSAATSATWTADCPFLEAEVEGDVDLVSKLVWQIEVIWKLLKLVQFIQFDTSHRHYFCYRWWEINKLHEWQATSNELHRIALGQLGAEAPAAHPESTQSIQTFAHLGVAETQA